MFVNREGVVSGSVNRAELAALHNAATDEDVKANLAATGVEHGMYVDRDGYLVDPSAPPVEEVEPEPEPEPQAEEEADAEPQRPAQADPKAAWIDWAVSQGADADEAEALTKAELIEFYGGSD